MKIYWVSPGIGYDTVEFCLSNLEQLCQSTSIFTKYFPNLLKVSINGLTQQLQSSLTIRS